ncbi:C-type lectin 2 [Plakobranchus ocellatus]|uniref:C-type lectin 2 n=1 Tax=Plakobranchus ocellatus TaxID=259542 RepID=A0AAV4CL43_9GAST|nr:C-type lectin 2 [Plakobranchus ocellatus]
MALQSILLLLVVLVIGTVQGYVAYDFLPVYRGRRYLISRNAEPFDLAKMNGRCRGSGGHLLKIDDYSEYRNLAYELSRMRDQSAIYTGITDLGIEGHFYNYNDKTPAGHLKWRRRQPDNWKGNENCVDISVWGFNDTNCGGNGRYMCEIPA